MKARLAGAVALSASARARCRRLRACAAASSAPRCPTSAGPMSTTAPTTTPSTATMAILAGDLQTDIQSDIQSGNLCAGSLRRCAQVVMALVLFAAAAPLSRRIFAVLVPDSLTCARPRCTTSVHDLGARALFVSLAPQGQGVASTFQANGVRRLPPWRVGNQTVKWDHGISATALACADGYAARVARRAHVQLLRRRLGRMGQRGAMRVPRAPAYERPDGQGLRGAPRAYRWVQGCTWLAAFVAHGYPRGCPMRGGPRVNSYRCARGNAAHHLRVSHSGYGHSAVGVGLHAAEGPTPAWLDIPRSGVRGRAGWVGAPAYTPPVLSRAQGNAWCCCATHTDPRTGTAGLGALDSCSTAAWQPVPVCAAVASRR